MKFKLLHFLKNNFILFIIQVFIAGFVWLLCDIIGIIYYTSYYIDIEQTPPFIREWENGKWEFFKYIIGTFIGIAIFWGIPFIINSILYLKYRNSYYVILFILSVSFLYTYTIFIYLLNIPVWNELYIWNELYRLMYSTTVFCILLLLKRKKRGKLF